MVAVKPRRPKGSGGICYATRKGQWTYRVELPPSPEGKRQGRYIAAVKFCAMLKKVRDQGAGAPLPKVARPRAAFNMQARDRDTHTRAEWHALYYRYRGKCSYCHEYAENPQRDHMTPPGRGGSDGIGNIAVSCHRCNRSKGSRTVDEFRDDFPLGWKFLFDTQEAE